MKVREDHEFQLEQNGMIVAAVFGPDRLQALREIMHYAAVYAQDGAVKIQGLTEEDWAMLAASIEEK